MLLHLACHGVSIIICRRPSFWQCVPLAFLLWLQLSLLLFHLDFSSSSASFPVSVSSFCRSPDECFLWITLSLFVLVFKINITGLWWLEEVLLLFFWLVGWFCLFACFGVGRGGGGWRESDHLPRKVVLPIVLWSSFLSGSYSWSNLCLFWDKVNNKVPLFLNQKMSYNFKYSFLGDQKIASPSPRGHLPPPKTWPPTPITEVQRRSVRIPVNAGFGLWFLRTA